MPACTHAFTTLQQINTSLVCFLICISPQSNHLFPQANLNIDKNRSTHSAVHPVLAVSENGCPQGDSNPCLGLERAPSWATRRWGLTKCIADSCQRCGLRRREAAQTSVRDCNIPHINRQRETHALRPVHARQWSATFRYRRCAMVP